MITPLFVVTGFLESGKTTMIKETLMEQDWIEDGLTLLLCCEEGEEEYPKEYLKEHNMVLLPIEELEDLNLEFFKNCQKNYQPAQVVVEYNGMWKLSDLLELTYPEDWELQGVYSTVNGETLQAYLMNMRNMLMEQLTDSELIVVNRCGEDVDRSAFRRAIKVQNPMAQLIFEDPSGQVIQPSAEDLPYDVKGEVVSLSDEDFGIWYVDAYEHPERYVGKIMKFKAQAFRQRGMKNDMFVPVRKIMTCCANDVRYYGYTCKLPKGKSNIPLNRWVEVEAKFAFEQPNRFAQQQPVLYLIDMKLSQKPKEEVVYI